MADADSGRADGVVSMKIRGWVYIIKNDAMPGLVKIGYSTKDPHLRAREFDGTASPHPYRVVYDALLFEPREVEQRVHALLKDKREGKEWFRCSIEDAVNAIRTVNSDQQPIETMSQQIVSDLSTVRFVDCQDGTTLDTSTGLMWASKDNGYDINWANAKSYCENYRGGGYTDWRIPTGYELDELYDDAYISKSACGDEVHLPELIKLTDIWVWTSESHCIEFKNGAMVMTLQSADHSRALPVRSAR